MTTRQRVSDRRAHETIAIEHEGHPYRIGLGREFANGGCGPVVEVFINAEHFNSTMDSMVSDGAILMSMLMQYGCPPETILKSMSQRSDGTPTSPLGRAAALIHEAAQGEIA